MITVFRSLIHLLEYYSSVLNETHVNTKKLTLKLHGLQRCVKHFVCIELHSIHGMSVKVGCTDGIENLPFNNAIDSNGQLWRLRFNAWCHI